MYHKLILLAESAGQGAASTLETSPEKLTGPIIMLVAAGSIVLTVWLFNTIARPGRVGLRRCPGRPNKLNPIHILVVFFLWHCLAMGVMEILSAMNFETLTKNQAEILSTIAGQIVAIPLTLFVGYRCFRHNLRRGMGLSMRHWLFDTSRGLVGYLAVFPVCFALVHLFTWLLPENLQSKHGLLVALGEMGPVYKTLIAVSAIVLAPLLEELFFRGLLQSMLRKYINPWPAILIASVIFTCVHPQVQNLPALLALGIVLGYNYERCGRLWPSILIHMLFNGVMITLYLLK